MLKGHVSPSFEARKEESTATFDLATAQKHVWGCLPSLYFSVYEALANFENPVKEAGLKPTVMNDMREEGNRYWIENMNNLFKLGLVTPEHIKENVDECLMGLTAISNFDGAALVKNSKHFFFILSGPLWTLPKDHQESRY